MQGKILIKPKRKRRPKVDQGIVNMPHDASSWGIGSSRLNGHQGGGRFEKQTLYRKFASFSSPYDKKKGCLDTCLEKIHINKRARAVFIHGQDVAKGPQDAENFESYDPRDYGNDEREVEIEKLRNALHVTPTEKLGLMNSNSMSLANSSGDLSREESGYLSNRSSVQKDRLSGLFKESRHDLENDVFLGHQSSSEEVPFSDLDNFKLKETGSSKSLPESFGGLQKWDKSSHTMEILTKARLCSERWGAASILLLDDLTGHLNRHEAATMFHHILGMSSAFILHAQFV